MLSFDTPDKGPSLNLDPQEESVYKERGYGRWNIKESQIYLEVLRNCEGIDVIRELKSALPGRI